MSVETAPVNTAAPLPEDEEMKPIHAFIAVMASIVAVFVTTVVALVIMEWLRPDGFNVALTNLVIAACGGTITALIGFATVIFRQGQTKMAAVAAANVAVAAKEEIIAAVKEK